MNSLQPENTPSEPAVIKAEREGLGLPRAQDSALENLSQLTALAARLLEGTSLNPFNQKIVALLSVEAKAVHRQVEAADFPLSPELVAKVDEIKSWFLFAVSNQNFCSPAKSNFDTIAQSGIVRIPEYVKYLRSEFNCQVFGEKYDRNSALIREVGLSSFRELSASYVINAVGRGVCSVPDLHGAAAMEGASAGQLLSVSARSKEELLDEVRIFAQNEPKKEFDGGIFASIKDALDADTIAALRGICMARGLNLIVAETFDPLKIGDSKLCKIRLFNDESDPLRYQLLQDSASMGYRPRLNDIVDYYFRAGRLAEILSFEGHTERSLPECPFTEVVHAGSAAAAEREQDYEVVLATLKNTRLNFEEASTGSVVFRQIVEQTKQESQKIEAELSQVLKNESSTVKDSVETFHRNYYRLRTLLQYSAKIAMTLQSLHINDLEQGIAAQSGGVVIAANSGISAARAVLMNLEKKVGSVVSTPHYWENDFLVENVFGRNPHYPHAPVRTPSRLTVLRADSTEIEIEQVVDEVAKKSAYEAQLICADRRISPFFYTKTFNLLKLCSEIERRGAEILNPLYVVVDTTLDLENLSPKALFPQGLPKNVFLIFTPSQAKLHQLGLDMVTGGTIEIFSHPLDRVSAHELRDSLRASLDAEGCRQAPLALKLLTDTFYSHHKSGSMAAYSKYMVEKRQRNTAALIDGVAISLEDRSVRRAPGVYRLLGGRNGEAHIQFSDPTEPHEVHKLRAYFHYDPQSRMHAYLKLIEPPASGTRYIAGALFNEMKRRIFAHAVASGIHIADGTSWGFPITRMDHYMHTLRIGVGLEHEQTLRRFGAIVSSVTYELLRHSEDFVRGVSVQPLTKDNLETNWEEIKALERRIPQTGDASLGLPWYQEKLAARSFSYHVQEAGRVVGILIAYESNVDGERVVYLSKAAVSADREGRGYFRRMLEFVKNAARAEGISKVVLQTSASEKNEAVVRAYERSGFSATELTSRLLPNGWPLVLVEMELSLERGSELRGVPFKPIPAEMYSRIKEGGDLSILPRLSVEVHGGSASAAALVQRDSIH